MHVEAGNESSQHERWRECQTERERERHPVGSQKVHFKQICYSKKRNPVQLKAPSAAERLKKHQVSKAFLPLPCLLLGLIQLWY